MKLMIKGNFYEVTKKAVTAILKQAEEYAKPGGIYAVHKGKTVILLNEQSSGKDYKRQGFEILRKEGEAIGQSN